MPCPTCSHTMAKLCDSDGIAYLLCPRCGTTRTEAVFPDQQPTYLPVVYVPKLVARCKQIATIAAEHQVCWLTADLKRVGVLESIYPEDQR